MEKFIRAIFCAPTGEYKDLGCPSRLTDEVFSSLKEAGINRIFGFGYDDREETKLKTLELCEKYDIGYFPSLNSFGAYVRLKQKGIKSFDELNENEVSRLDEDLIEEVYKYSKYKSFKGVFFADEAGYLSLNGVAHAKKIFSIHFPSLEFHFNFYSYSINESIFWGGMELSRNPSTAYEKPFELDDEHKIVFKNRFNYYSLLVDHLLDQTHFEFISQDKYPFETFWPTLPTSVHVALFELNGYFAEKKKRYGFNFYNYLQAGQWFENKSRLHMSKGEMLLQTNVTIGYGHEGFAYFPGCFPIDYILDGSVKESRYGRAGLIDINGSKSEIYGFVKEENDFLSLIESDLLSSKFIGVTSVGKYDNGYKEEEISKLPDNECIFRGDLGNFVRYDNPSIKVNSTNEVMISTFIKDGMESYFITNLSSVYSNNVEIDLGGFAYELIKKKETKQVRKLVSVLLGPGEALYLRRI